MSSVDWVFIVYLVIVAIAWIFAVYMATRPQQLTIEPFSITIPHFTVEIRSPAAKIATTDAAPSPPAESGH